MDLRVPPHNLEAEESVLGGLMLEAEAYLQVSEHINEEDFYKNAHRKVFIAIRSLYAKSEPIDIITVSNWLRDKQELDGIGGASFLADLMDRIPSAVNIESYAKIVREKSLLRRLITTNSEITERAFTQKYDTVESFLDEVEGQIFKIADKKESRSGLIGAAELIKASINQLTLLSQRTGDVTGIESGYSDLDTMTAGFQPGDLVILAARPSMGKTAFSLNIAQHVAFRLKKSVAYFSVEMAKEQLMMRMLASEARVGLGDVRIGRIKDSDWPRIIDRASVMADAKLFIDDTSGISPFEIRTKCRRLKAQHGLDLIMIDYLQIMNLKQKVDSREREVAEISKNLKAIAKELQVPVIALSQLNRGVEGRSGDQRKPVLSDLRESGSIEQDADLIMMLYREEYYEPDNAEVKGLADVLVRKHRNGPVGDIKLRWEGQFGRFTKWEGPPAHNLPETESSNKPKQNNPFDKPRNFAPGANFK